MNRLASWMKHIRFRQILTAFLAGVLLLAGTACSALQAKTASDVRSDVPSAVKGQPAGQVREDLPKSAVDSSVQGGINVYPDTDPRKNTSRTESKTQKLIENAERQVIDESGDVVGNTKRILDKKGENLKDLGENAQEDAAALGKRTGRATEELSDKAQSNLESATEGLQKLGNQTQRAAENTAQSAKSGLNQATKSTQRAAEDAAQSVKAGTNQATRSTQRALEDTADTIR